MEALTNYTLPDHHSITDSEITQLLEIINILPQPIYIENEAHECIDVNDAFCDFFNCHKERLVGSSSLYFCNDHQREIFQRNNKQVHVSQSDSTHVQKMKTSCGQDRWIRIRKGITHKKNSQSYVICVLEDITIEKQREDELLNKASSARRGITDRAKFLANMGHNIRIPINEMNELTLALNSTPLDFEQDKLVKDMQRANDKFTGMIDNIVDLSCIDAGQMKLENKSFNLSDVIENLAFILGVEARNKGVDLIFSVSPYLNEAVVGDPKRLEQILMNLLENAVKFTTKGHVSLTVEKSSLKCDGHVTFKVSDSGVGISPTELKHMFGSVTSKRTSLEEFDGICGAGLPLCIKLTKLMGGSLTAKSNLAGGSEFKLRLPIISRNTKKCTTPFIPIAEHNLNHKILIVDDIKANFNTLSILLETFGLKADYAESARRAAQKLTRAYNEDNPYSLVFVDYCMPETDGLLLTSYLRQSRPFSNLNIIAVSAVNDPEIMQAFMGHGVVDYLVKPVRLKTLKTALKKVPKIKLSSVA